MRKYVPFFKGGMMNEMAYKVAIYSWVFISFLQLACVVFLWKAVYSNSQVDVINGFTYRQVIVYFVFANIFAFTFMGSPTLEEIDHEIKDGTIAISFIKPISYRIRFLANAYGGCATRFIIMGMPAMIIAFYVFIKMNYVKINSIPTFIAHVILFFVCTIFSIAIMDAVNYLCGVMCFYTTAAWGINQTKEVLLSFFSGVFVPLSFFPGIFGKIAVNLPFAGMTQNCILILTQSVDIKTSIIFIVKNIVWCVVFEVCAKILFMHASKKVTVQGG